MRVRSASGTDKQGDGQSQESFSPSRKKPSSVKVPVTGHGFILLILLCSGCIGIFADDTTEIIANTSSGGTEPDPDRLIGNNSSEQGPAGDTDVSLPGDLIPLPVIAENSGSMNQSEPENSTEAVKLPAIAGNQTATPEYQSVGDIIRAQDWKALSEYRCRMKTENPDSFDEPGSGNNENRWNSYFTAPPAPVVIPGCCG